MTSVIYSIRGHYVLVDDQTDAIIDHFRTRSGAEHAAHLLNRGVASVNPHAIVGCKVVAS